MMKRKLVFSCLFIFILLAALLLNMPAKYALGMAAKHTGLFSFSSATGTLFTGSANVFRVRVKNRVLDFGRLDWQLSPWALLVGKVNIDFVNKQSPQSIAIKGMASINWQKNLTVEDAEIKTPVPVLIGFSPMPVKASGDVELSITQLLFTDNKVQELQGQLLLQSLQVSLQQSVSLGTFAARLSNDGDALVADVTDIDSDIGVAGQAIFAQQEQSFDTDITITTNANTPQVLTQSLPFFARKTGENTFAIQQSGRL